MGRGDSCCRLHLGQHLLPALVTVAALMAELAGPAGAQAAGSAQAAPVVWGERPSEGRETLRLAEVWRAGGANEDVVFGLVTRVRAGQDGNIYVFDGQLCRVHVFSPEGKPLRTLFGEGEGPGEVRRPRDTCLLDGGRVGVAQIPGQIVTVAADGTPAGSLTLSGGQGHLLVHSAACGGGNLVCSGDEMIQGDRDLAHRNVTFLAAFDRAGRPTARYLEVSRDVDYMNDYTFREKEALVNFAGCFDVGPDGRVYVLADQDHYAVSVFHPDGTPDRVIERPYTVRRRTPDEARRMRALVDRRFRTFPYKLSVEMADTEPVVDWLYRGLTVLPDGTLWVRHSRSSENQPRGVMLAFDVFDREGRYVKEVAAVCDGDPLHDGLFPIGQDRFVLVRGFTDAMRTLYGGGQGGFEGEGEPEPLEVICLRAVR
jgi:hypothetical protein